MNPGVCISLCLALGVAAARTAAAEDRAVLVAGVSGPIGPITARFMMDAMARAEARPAEAVVFELDTPGGLDDSMRDIVKRIMAARVPVVVYVAPAGSRAASAGAFITLAAHVAAMAPGTAIGAAHPVALGQGAPADSNLAAKATHDAAAYIRSIAEKRGRNLEWADQAVRDSVSLSETEAVARRVVDLVATNTAALLECLDGRAVVLDDGRRVVLRTRGVAVERLAMNWRDDILQILSNPNIAYLLFMLGLLGIYFELSNPGTLVPGIIGAIAIILAFFAFQTLPVNYAGILLILLALALFVAEIYVVSSGLLTVGGIVAMIIGSLMLFRPQADPALRLSLQVLIPVLAATCLFFAVGVALSVRSMARRPVSGAAGLVGQAGDARTAVGPGGGTVFVAGAHWNAESGAELPAGSRVRVVAVSGMTLRVEAEAGRAD